MNSETQPSEEFNQSVPERPKIEEAGSTKDVENDSASKVAQTKKSSLDRPKNRKHKEKKEIKADATKPSSQKLKGE